MAKVQEIRDPNTNLLGKLLDQVGVHGDGSWTEVMSRDKFSIHVIFGAGASGVIQICGSNEDAPVDSNDGVDLIAAGLTNLATSGNNIAANSMVAVKIPVRWIKAKPVSLSGGPVSAILIGV